MDRARNDVWDFLRKHGIKELPVPCRELAGQMQIQIIDYEVGAEMLYRLGLDKLKARKEGFSVQTENHAYIFMRRGLSKARQNHIILHEIGHFAEGQNDLLTGAAAKRTAAEERMAEEYVYEMTPTPVLYAAGLTTLEDIRRITGLDTPAARHILARVAACAHGERTEEERRIIKQFGGFIRRQKRNRGGRLRKYLLSGLMGVLLLLIVLGLSLVWRFPPQPAPPAERPSPPSVSAEAAGAPVSSVDVSGDCMVYWTDTGEVYHLSRTCRYIRDKKEEALQSGSAAKAREEGKERPCKICGDAQSAE